jgi:hypothetical protein
VDDKEIFNMLLNAPKEELRLGKRDPEEPYSIYAKNRNPVFGLLDSPIFIACVKYGEGGYTSVSG